MRFSYMGLLALALASASSVAEAGRTPKEEALLQEMRSAASEQGMVLTPEMESVALDTMRRAQAHTLGLRAAATAVATNSTQAPSTADEPVSFEANATLDATPTHSGALPQAQGQLTRFGDLPDGFTVNGRPWLDPEGEIRRHSSNAQTGEVTYFVSRQPGSALVKYVNVNDPGTLTPLGRVVSSAGREEYEGFDGVRLAGQQVLPTSRGLIAYRQGALFHLEFGNAPKSHALPAGFQVSPWQTGDVSGTGYLLIYRRAGSSGVPFADFTKYTKATFGNNMDSDAMFFNIESGAAVPLAISGRRIHDGSNLFDDVGLRNDQHLKWRARWYATEDGPIAMVKEDGPSRLTVINLDTGKRAIAFERKLGLGDWDLFPTEDGALRFEGSWAFKSHKIADVRELLRE